MKDFSGIIDQVLHSVIIPLLPLCANIHMAGSMITITACATAVCLMNQLPISLAAVVPFIMTLGVAMAALYITQDPFGTACNVSGDNAIGVIVETIYRKFINKSSANA